MVSQLGQTTLWYWLFVQNDREDMYGSRRVWTQKKRHYHSRSKRLVLSCTSPLTRAGNAITRWTWAPSKASHVEHDGKMHPKSATLDELCRHLSIRSIDWSWSNGHCIDHPSFTFFFFLKKLFSIFLQVKYDSWMKLMEQRRDCGTFQPIIYKQ